MKIKLYNLKMNYDGDDRLFYQTKAERDSDFSDGFSEKDTTAFKRVSALDFEITVHDSFDNLEYNYALYNGYHCFIDSIIESTQNQTRVKLKLDVITQYLNGELLDTQKEVMVRRTHLDRFVLVDPQTNEYRFNFDDDDLLVKEDVNIEPTIYTDNNFGLTQYPSDTVKWLVVTKTSAESSGGGFNLHDLIRNRFYESNIEKSTALQMPNTSFVVPLGYNNVEFRINGQVVETSKINEITEVATTSDVLNVVVLPYFPNDLVEDVSHDDARFTTIVDLVDGLSESFHLNKLDSSNNDTYMITSVTFGDYLDLDITTGRYPNADNFAHKPIFTLNDIVNDESLEPKMLQFRKYDFSFLQNRFDAFFDQFKNDDLVIKLQMGLNYATERFDFYLRSGNYANLENTGAMITAIADMTLAQNIDQWKEYITQKKTTSSSGYAYGGQIFGTVAGAGFNFATGNVFGAGASVVSGASGIAQTYAQRQDLKQAPNSIKARGGNVLNDFPYEELFYLSASEVVPTETEKKFLLNRFIYDGYLLNEYRNLKDIIDTRENFNYVELASNENFLIKSLPTEIHTELNTLMNRGVRLYKGISKIQNKTKINLERSL